MQEGNSAQCCEASERRTDGTHKALSRNERREGAQLRIISLEASAERKTHVEEEEELEQSNRVMLLQFSPSVREKMQHVESISGRQ